jgi:hypothetical protein
MVKHWTPLVKQPVNSELDSMSRNPAKGPEMVVYGIVDEKRVIRLELWLGRPNCPWREVGMRPEKGQEFLRGDRSSDNRIHNSESAKSESEKKSLLRG